MKKDVVLQAKFDEMVDSFDQGDSITVKDVNLEMRKSWLDFLEAGFDANQVAKMMSRKERWKHYDVLLSYGVSIDVSKVMRAFNKEFVLAHWDEFAERGASAEALIKKCYDDDVDTDEKVEFLLDKGVNVETVFGLAKSLLEFDDGRPERLSETFSILRKYGLPIESMTDWLKLHAEENVDDIVEFRPGVWQDLGVNVSDYVDLWIEHYGENRIYYSCDGLKNLPEAITLDRFIGSYSMREILDITKGEFFDFVDDYVRAGGDVNALAKRFIDEIGYSEFDPMFGLVVAGATIIDMEKFVNSCEFDKLDELGREYYYTSLKDLGVDEVLLDKFLFLPQ